MKSWIVSGAALAALFAAPAFAQASGRRTAAGCLDIANTPITLEGRLTRRVFAGPPNFQDVRRGDAAEPSFILVLPGDICIDDHGEQADPRTRFRNVHLYSNDASIRRRLRAAVDRPVRVSGEGLAAITGHHHAPLVVEVRRLTLLPGRR